ncbi:hypothetical protein [Succiniclasticum ruminis]|nr:hypothetical protein [Succiniclasticum ruminis]
MYREPRQIQRARKAACGRIVGLADVGRLCGKSRSESSEEGGEIQWQQ